MCVKHEQIYNGFVHVFQLELLLPELTEWMIVIDILYVPYPIWVIQFGGLTIIKLNERHSYDKCSGFFQCSTQFKLLLIVLMSKSSNIWLIILFTV